MMPRDLSEDQLNSIARALKSARELRAESVADAAFKIALSPAQIRAIEAGDLKPFYSSHYFLQAAQRYADFLGIALTQATPPIPNQSSQAADQLRQTSPDQPEADLTQPAPPVKATPATPPHIQSKPDPAAKTQAARSSVRPWLAAALGLGLTAAIGLQMLGGTPAPAPTPSPSPLQATAASPQGSVDLAQAAPAVAPLASTNAATRSPSVPTSAASHLSVSSATWVQIVLNSGEKQNFRIEPGQKIGFEPEKTAAIVFGKPEQAELNVNGRRVDITPFMLAETPSRALVLLNKVR